MCYLCGNEHSDRNHTIDWGFDIFKAMEAPRDEKNEAFNAGYRTLFDFEKAKCPCGGKLVGKKVSCCNNL